MSRAFKKYFHYVVILLLIAWGYQHAHAQEQTTGIGKLHVANICTGPSLECNDLTIGHGHSKKVFRDRVKYITEENFRAVFRSSDQKQVQAVTNYFMSALVSLPHYLLRLHVITLTGHHLVPVKSSLYILLRVLRI